MPPDGDGTAGGAPADGDPSATTAPGVDADPVHVEDLVADVDALSDTVESPHARETLAELESLLHLAGARGLIDSSVRRLDPRDAAEALVGSVVFASPLLVEDGLFDIADHLLTTSRGVPVFFVCNVLFVVVMTYALVEWTGRNRTDSHYVLGVVPARVVMILAVSFATTAALMAVWGRIGPWLSPTEALARVCALWTVGAIGAGLGDVLAEGNPDAPAMTGETGTESALSDPETLDEGDLVAALNDRFDRVSAAIADDPARRELDRIEARANRAAADDLFGDSITKYTSRDVAEAFVGSVVFAIPLLVEDGVFDVADYLQSVAVGGLPVFFLANTGFVLVMIAAICYWTGPQDVRVTRPLFGFVPRRLVGIALVSFLTAAALMTLWGRLDGWVDPVVAVTRINTVWAVAAFGASLGDILPGESSGADINDHFDDIADGDDGDPSA